MPVSRKSRQPSKAPASKVAVARRIRRGALIVVDNVPLQREAWAEFHTVKKRLDKVSRDLHRHEEVDTPAYEAWLHRTFPVQITRLRELQEQVFAKGRRVEMVQTMGYLTGRPLKKLWRELKEREEHPELFDEDDWAEDPDTDARSSDEDGWKEEETETKSRGKKNREKSEYSEEHYSDRRRGGRTAAADREGPAPTADAKAIYRRLVQRLHPDRGGDWTPSRERLWHDVQLAWSRGDVDWLARLEVEWETANDELGPTSPVSRLRQAIAELHGARRDLERKLREYREAFSWRFCLREKDRAELRRRIDANFKHDISYLAGQLRYLDATIAAWESSARARRGVYD